MIDWTQEAPLTLEQLRQLPVVRAMGRNGNPPDKQTIWRWARHGIRGVKLEVDNIGRRVATSYEAFERFVEALSGRERPVRTRSQGRKAQARAEKILKAAGI